MLIFKLIGCKPLGQNRKLARGRGSRLYKNSDYVKSWNHVKAIMLSQSVGVTLDDKSEFRVDIVIPRTWKEDTDAWTKEVRDIMQGFVYKDDRQVKAGSYCQWDNSYMQIMVSKL